jgi:chlorite dismutase
MSADKPEGQPQRPMPGTAGRGTATIDTLEYGGEKDGQRQSMDRRLFMQLLAYTAPPEMPVSEVIGQLGRAFEQAGVAATIYEDVNHPQGLAVLTWSENPQTFVDDVRPILNSTEMRKLVFRDEYTMLGRSYSIGYEQDLVERIITSPIERASRERHWAVWYPLRRKGEFNRLSRDDQMAMLREHGAIGRAYGEQGLATDIRLACHGLDKNDNEFIIGLIGDELFPLSHVVQAMRKTRQTAEFMECMGPFFVGRAAFCSKGRG